MVITLDNVPLMEQQVCNFMFSYLNYNTYPYIFEACHLLGTWKKGHVLSSKNGRFAYFKEKSEIFARTSMLSKCNSRRNGRPFSTTERLIKKQKIKDDKADKTGLTTTSYNCIVKVLMRTDDNTLKSVVVKSKKNVGEVKEQAVKKQHKSGEIQSKLKEDLKVKLLMLLSVRCRREIADP